MAVNHVLLSNNYVLRIYCKNTRVLILCQFKQKLVMLLFISWRKNHFNYSFIHLFVPPVAVTLFIHLAICPSVLPSIQKIQINTYSMPYDRFGGLRGKSYVFAWRIHMGGKWWKTDKKGKNWTFLFSDVTCIDGSMTWMILVIHYGGFVIFGRWVIQEEFVFPWTAWYCQLWIVWFIVPCHCFYHNSHVWYKLRFL